MLPLQSSKKLNTLLTVIHQSQFRHCLQVFLGLWFFRQWRLLRLRRHLRHRRHLSFHFYQLWEWRVKSLRKFKRIVSLFLLVKLVAVLLIFLFFLNRSVILSENYVYSQFVEDDSTYKQVVTHVYKFLTIFIYVYGHTSL